MKKKEFKKKLSLEKVTISKLTDENLENIYGGQMLSTNMKTCESLAFTNCVEDPRCHVY